MAELPAVGDFVKIYKGDSYGMEGCIQAIGDDVDKTYTIATTSAYSTLPSVVVEDDDCVEPPLVSHSSIPIAHLTDRVTHSSRLLSFLLCLLTYVYTSASKSLIKSALLQALSPT